MILTTSHDHIINKFSKHLNIILSISHLGSAECTKVWRVHAFASLEARYVTQLRRRNAASFEIAIRSFLRQKITDEKYAC